VNRQDATDMPDPDGEFLHSLLSNVKTVDAKQKHFFVIVVTLINEIFGNTESDGWSSVGLVETFTVYSAISMLNSQVEQYSCQSFSAFWEQN